MRICIPVTSDNGLNASLYTHFGSAPYYAIVETDTGVVLTVNNGDCRHQHGQCAPVHEVRRYGIEAVVCNSMGRRAFESLQSAGIDVMLSDAATVRGVLAAVRDNAVKGPELEDMCSGHSHQTC